MKKDAFLSSTHRAIMNLAPDAHETHAVLPGPFSWPVEIQALSTSRLVLRKHRESDLQAYYALYRDPEVCKYDDSDPLDTLDEAREGLAGTIAAWEERE